MRVSKRAWQLWKPLKTRWLLLCFQHRKGQGGPGRVLGSSLGGLGRPEALGWAPRGSLRGAHEVGGLKAKILGGFVITWGGGAPEGALGGSPRSYEYHWPGSVN